MSACASRHPKGVKCVRRDGHSGVHWDSKHSELWTSAERVREEPPTEAEAPPLTSGEVEVLALVAEGCGQTEIGRRLFLSPDTVKYRKHRIYVKTGTTTAAAAVAWGFRNGLLT